MSLTRTKSQLEKDLDALDESVLRSGAALNHAAAVLRNEHSAFWSLPVDRLLAVLNADVPHTLTVFAANSATADALNSQLDALDKPQFTNRAPSAIGKEGISFDAQIGQFIYTEPPAPEPDPEP